MTSAKIDTKSILWPWALLGIGILSLLIYLLFLFTSGERKAGLENTEGADLLSVRENNTTVTAFVKFINNDTNNTVIYSSYINTALLKLTRAVGAMAAETGYNARADLDKAREYESKIANDLSGSALSENTRNTADILATLLQKMQQAKYPELTFESDELKNAAATINPHVSISNQRTTVKSFFIKAADILQEMN